MHRPTTIIIDQTAISRNIQAVRTYFATIKRPIDTFIAVVKANGYGHGLIEASTAAINGGADYLGVATLDEALKIREQYNDIPIIVFGPTEVESLQAASNHNIILTIPSIQWLEDVVDTYSTIAAEVHLKIDSGMNRIGIRSLAEVEACKRLIEQCQLNLTGIYTHFSMADDTSREYTDHQAAHFMQCVDAMDNEQLLVHAANSATTLRFPEFTFDAVRFGMGLYGESPFEGDQMYLPISLNRALTLVTKVAVVKELKKGDLVSYGGIYRANEGDWVASVPIGYADGLPRNATGMEVLIQGKRYPIVGRLCMDQLMIKVDSSVKAGMIVTLMGQDGDDRITPEEWAQATGTIKGEIFARLSPRINRQLKG